MLSYVIATPPADLDRFEARSTRDLIGQTTKNARAPDFFTAEHRQDKARCGIAVIKHSHRGTKKSPSLLKCVPRAFK